eukprot:m.76568 g.76568  ORF g.76568 m.76568 type:complete len:824 (+) comp12564_c0_seq1:193-2664(+)
MPRNSTIKKKNVDRALYDAVKQGNLRLVKGYLTAGANPNAVVGKKGLTAMHRATKRKKNEDLLAVLVEHGGISSDKPSQQQIDFKKGDSVSLTSNFRDIGNAMYGPLESTYDVGLVIDVVNTDEDECIKVSFNGTTFMYSPDALRKPSPADTNTDTSKSTRKKASALQLELSQQLAQLKPREGQGMSRLAHASIKSIKGREPKREEVSPEKKSPEKQTSPTKITKKASKISSPPGSPKIGRKQTKLEPKKTEDTPYKMAQKKDEKAGPESYRVPSMFGQPSPQDWEFDRGKVTQGEKLGEGMFGLVYAGVAKDLVPGQKETKVAIKTLADESPEVEKDFFKEAEIMQAIDGPFKIVRLLGVCTKERPYWMLMELMAKGDLKTVLRDHRPKKKKPSSFNMRQLAQMAVDISEGMDYLQFKHIVHRDLAARNCLVDDAYNCKIGDFGLTRNVYQDEYYRMTGSAPLPVRWMAPEALVDGLSTSKSDVWAFGIVLWELMTFAKLPYGLLSNNEVCDMVTEEEYRMPMPKGCPEPLYDIMLECWADEADDRPDFREVCEKLKVLLPSFSTDPLEYLKKDTGVAPKDDSSGYQSPADAYMQPAAPDAFDSDDNEDQQGQEEEELPDKDVYAGDNTNGDDTNKVTLRKTDTYGLREKSEENEESRMSGLLAHIQKVTNANPSSEHMDQLSKRVSALYSSPSPSSDIKRQNTTVNDLEDEIKVWITKVTSVPITDDLHSALKTGELLCNLINVLVPGSVPKAHTGKKCKIAFRQMENIGWFLEVARIIGVTESDLFITNDLFENLNMKQVLICLNSVKKITSSPTFSKTT